MPRRRAAEAAMGSLAAASLRTEQVRRGRLGRGAWQGWHWQGSSGSRAQGPACASEPTPSPCSSAWSGWRCWRARCRRPPPPAPPRSRSWPPTCSGVRGGGVRTGLPVGLPGDPGCNGAPSHCCPARARPGPGGGRGRRRARVNGAARGGGARRRRRRGQAAARLCPGDRGAQPRPGARRGGILSPGRSLRQRLPPSQIPSCWVPRETVGS
jgi:hypothetical protein